jgi:hypothetical protein
MLNTFRNGAVGFIAREAMECLMKAKRIVAILVPLFAVVFGASICNADGFDSVRCGSDVRKALLGRPSSCLRMNPKSGDGRR